MATYVLIPGAASGPWYRHLLEAELRRRGHDVVAVIPGDHCPTLGHPAELADHLEAYRTAS
ncbi:hypothetical protein [Kitasatospora sp. NPDC091276]|uniref:hypothetical protein n=1 Tax=Kitasatospora sp. NPDC091276 TaxID=3155300 RepID=UPI00343CFB11